MVTLDVLTTGFFTACAVQNDRGKRPLFNTAKIKTRFRLGRKRDGTIDLCFIRFGLVHAAHEDFGK